MEEEISKKISEIDSIILREFDNNIESIQKIGNIWLDEMSYFAISYGHNGCHVMASPTRFMLNKEKCTFIKNNLINIISNFKEFNGKPNTDIEEIFIELNYINGTQKFFYYDNSINQLFNVEGCKSNEKFYEPSQPFLDFSNSDYSNTVEIMHDIEENFRKKTPQYCFKYLDFNCKFTKIKNNKKFQLNSKLLIWLYSKIKFGLFLNILFRWDPIYLFLKGYNDSENKSHLRFDYSIYSRGYYKVLLKFNSLNKIIDINISECGNETIKFSKYIDDEDIIFIKNGEYNDYDKEFHKKRKH